MALPVKEMHTVSCPPAVPIAPGKYVSKTGPIVSVFMCSALGAAMPLSPWEGSCHEKRCAYPLIFFHIVYLGAESRPSCSEKQGVMQNEISCHPKLTLIHDHRRSVLSPVHVVCLGREVAFVIANKPALYGAAPLST